MTSDRRDDGYVFFIAEIGINHNGDLEIAKKLIDMAKAAGCDAVKFQKRTIDVVYTPAMLDLPRESPWGTTQREQKARLEFGRKEYDFIDGYCREQKIDWFASAWDLESLRFLESYSPKYHKVASAMLRYPPLLERIAKEGKPTFISTGMATLDDIDRAVGIFQLARCPFTLMHCVGTYPVEEYETNVRMVATLKERYGCPVGYSGHETGILPSIVAVVLGASAIERHITLDRAMYGSDQPASLEKRGLELLVRYCRDVHPVLSDGVKRFTDAERAVATKLRWFEATP